MFADLEVASLKSLDYFNLIRSESVDGNTGILPYMVMNCEIVTIYGIITGSLSEEFTLFNEHTVRVSSVHDLLI